MPPGLRPTQGNVRPPMQTSNTAAVAQGGRAAIDAQKQAASYGLTGQAQALKDLYDQINTVGSGYSANPAPTSQYNQWLQAQGFGQASNGPVSIAPKTHAEFKTAVMGQADLNRQHQADQAAQLKDQLGQRFDALGGQFRQSAAVPTGANIAALASLGQAQDRNDRSFGAAVGHPAPALTGMIDQRSQLAQQQGQRTGDFMGQLNDWYSKQGQPLVAGMETANQITKTPLRDYELKAAQDYGVDPNLAAGWFPESSDVADAANQRNIESLNTTGLPYQEQQTALSQAADQSAQQQKQYTADQQLAMSNDIYGVTSYPGDQLAQAVQAPLDAVHQVVTDPAYTSYVATVENAKAQAEQANPKGDAAAQAAIQAAVDDAIQAAVDDVSTVDPNTAEVLGRILHAQEG